MSNITRNDRKAWLELIWNALEYYRENGISETTEWGNDSETAIANDKEWDEICTVMAWVEEDLNLVDEVDTLLVNVR